MLQSTSFLFRKAPLIPTKVRDANNIFKWLHPKFLCTFRQNRLKWTAVISKACNEVRRNLISFAIEVVIDQFTTMTIVRMFTLWFQNFRCSLKFAIPKGVIFHIRDGNNYKPTRNPTLYCIIVEVVTEPGAKRHQPRVTMYHPPQWIKSKFAWISLTLIQHQDSANC